MRTRRLVRCTVGQETFCIDSDWLDSIQVIENLYPSRSADGAIGWIRRFDEKVPVFRLADQLYGPSGRAQSRQGVIMVLRRADRLWALLVDKVMGATAVAEDHVFPLPPVINHAESAAFVSVVLEESGLSLALAPEKLVPASVSGVEEPPPSARKTAPAATSVRSALRSAPALNSGLKEEKGRRQIITFALQQQSDPGLSLRFAVSAGQALEILSGLPMIPVPNAPPFLVGLANWRSLPIPVVDLGTWLGMDPAPVTPGCRLLLCRGTVQSDARTPGLLAIPSVDDFRKVDLPISYQPWPTQVRWNASLALGIYHAERGMLIVPDLDAILSFQMTASDYRM